MKVAAVAAAAAIPLLLSDCAALTMLFAARADATPLVESLGIDLPAPTTSMDEARRRLPELGAERAAGVELLHRVYYPAITVEDLAGKLGVRLWRPKPLAPLDRWRFESCIADASNAPTAYGVSVGTLSCKHPFEQVEPELSSERA